MFDCFPLNRRRKGFPKRTEYVSTEPFRIDREKSFEIQISDAIVSRIRVELCFADGKW